MLKLWPRKRKGAPMSVVRMRAGVQRVMKMFRFAIDRGGTFTDVYAQCPDGSVRVMKLLSEDPDNYPDAPREAIRRIMQEVRVQAEVIVTK